MPNILHHCCLTYSNFIKLISYVKAIGGDLSRPQTWGVQPILRVWSAMLFEDIVYSVCYTRSDSREHESFNKAVLTALGWSGMAPWSFSVCWAKSAAHLQRLTLRTSLTPRPAHWESASLFILKLNNSQFRLKSTEWSCATEGGLTQGTR